MEEIMGKRNGTSIYVYDGHVYHMDKRCNGIYRCASRQGLGCYAVLIRNPNETYTLRTLHNHPSNETILQEIKMKQEMLRICRETIMKPKDIFDTVCRRNPVAAKKLSYRTMRSFLYREQIRHRPEIPQTIAELEIALINYQPTERIYKGTILSDNGYRAVLFTTDALLNALAAATEIFMDGTFSVVPRVPPFVQLYIIHIRYMDTGIPVLFALCEKRTMDVYNAIWQRVKELHPNALQRVQSIMSDYERAAMTVAREIFPQARITGCWFHFNQAVLRHWKALGLTAAPRKVLDFTMALPLAPVNAFEEGLQIIQKEADLISTEYPAVLQFTVYLRRIWLPLKDKVSVFGTSIRTNNLVETFHYVLSRRFGGIHPNIWQFLHNLGELISDQEINIERLAEGHSIKRVRVRHNIIRDKCIAEAQASLSLKRLSLKEFLQTLSRMSQIPEENFDLQGDILYDILEHQEIIDSNLLDAHTVQESVSVSHTVIEDQEAVIKPIIINAASDRHGLSQASITADSEPDSERLLNGSWNRIESDSEQLLNNITRTSHGRGRPPRSRGRPPRSRGRPSRNRGRLPRYGCNLQRAAETFESISQITQETYSVEIASENLDMLTLGSERALTIRSRRSRGRPPSRRGRRGRFATLSRIEDITEHTSSEQENEETEMVSSGLDQNEMMDNENFENIFRIPEDDFETISLSDNEEEVDLPFYPVTTVPDITVSSKRTDNTCCICLNAITTYVFVPCGHLCICNECQEQLEDHKCPLCRKEYTHCIRAITI